MDKDLAYKRAIRFLKKQDHTSYNLYPVNKKRHIILEPVNKDCASYYLAFKREWYKTFSFYFKSFVSTHPDYIGWGQSLNKECLYLAHTKNIDYLLFIMDDGKIYKIATKLFLKFSTKHNLIRGQNKTNLYSRADYSGEREMINEWTYCVPGKLLERLN